MRLVGRLAFMVVLALAMAGCATSGLKFTEFSAKGPAIPEDSGRIYIYRTTALGAALQPEIKINGEVVGRAVPMGFFYVDRKPGPYTIETTTEVTRKLSLTLEPGQKRYVRLNISFGFFVGHVYPELIDNETAQKEILDCRYTGK